MISKARRTLPAVMATALILMAASPLAGASEVGAGWTYIGSGPLATSTTLSASARYPTGIQAGDLLILNCQGRRNAMQWSAAGYESAFGYDDQWPQGPSGLQFELLYRWADGTEGAAVAVRNTTGVNGWSCVASAFRGGAGTGRPITGGGGTISPSGTRVMSSDSMSWRDGIEDHLVVHWFVSSDDNNHGQASYGMTAYGGTAYDTGIGTDHAVSMVLHQGDPGLTASLTMRQRSNGPDAYTSFSIALMAGP